MAQECINVLNHFDNEDFPLNTTCTLQKDMSPETKLVPGGHTVRQLHQRIYSPPEYKEHIDEDYSAATDDFLFLSLKETLSTNGKEDSEVLGIMKCLFNRTIFGGALAPKFCNMRFIPRSDPDWGRKGNPKNGQPSTRGYLDTMLTRKCGGHVTGTINIFELPWHTGNKTQQERMLFYGGTLLHEMLHCYFWIYTCRCQSCCKLPGGWSQQSVEGQHGHYWQYSALLVEDAANHVTDMEWDLSRSTSMAFDMAAYGTRVSSAYAEVLKLDASKFPNEYSPRVVEDALPNVLYTARKVELEETIREILDS